MDNKKYITISAKQTQKIGEIFAKKFLNAAPKNSAVILSLRGDLGSGKTTFLQGFAKKLGVKDKITSPTFVILKKFKIQNGYFYHIDCYRLKDHKDMLALGLKDITKNPKNILAIEWSEKIKNILPKDAIFIDFKFIDNNKREIIFKT